MITSSRESLLDEQLFISARFQMLQIQPLTVLMQDDVVQRRFSGTALLQRHEVEQAMAAFKQQARSSPSLCEMGANPLLLALLIGVFLRGRQQLPELRTQLYEKGVQLLLRRVEVGETGKRDPKALAAVLKDKPQRTQRRQRRRQQQATPTVDKAKDPASDTAMAEVEEFEAAEAFHQLGFSVTAVTRA